jgi:hypothetical protein
MLALKQSLLIFQLVFSDAVTAQIKVRWNFNVYVFNGICNDAGWHYHNARAVTYLAH